MSSRPGAGPTCMLIIAGYLVVDPGSRDSYVAECARVVQQARSAPGCLEFAITADTVDPARVQVYERWEGEEQLLAFRGAGPDAGQQASIRDADVKRYTISAVGAP
jgi:quinol monooxygenase YgiN